MIPLLAEMPDWWHTAITVLILGCAWFGPWAAGKCRRPKSAGTGRRG